MRAWTSSGSSFSDSAVKPETSTKSTVTSLRSPCSEDRDVRILSARYCGVYTWGQANRSRSSAVCIAPKAWPHFLQNRLLTPFGVWHCGHRTRSGVPHSGQNSASEGASARQREHFTG